MPGDVDPQGCIEVGETPGVGSHVRGKIIAGRAARKDATHATKHRQKVLFGASKGLHMRAHEISYANIVG